MEHNYDLSKAQYNKNNKICVICHKKDKNGVEHGEFWITPSNLKYGYGCPKCKGEKISELKSITQEEFIRKAREVHGDKYDYSKVEYKNSQGKICIVCPEHGEFWQIATQHIQGCGCPKCAGVHKSSTEEFIEKAKQIHDDKYDYSKVNYINNHTKVCIICPEHGEFWQTPKNHLKGQGCNQCAIEYRGNKLKNTIEKFIEKARKIHGNKYDYSKVEYKNSISKIHIICPIHGEFEQVAAYHLSGNGCPKCANNTAYTTEEFIKRAKEKHGDKYDYSKTNYINAYTKVCIICPEHGEFWQTPRDHLHTNGCKECGITKRIENRTYSIQNFINKAKEVHGDKYDYSKVEYTKSNEKICIICPKHGEFWQIAADHLQGCGCPKCSVRQSKAEDEIVSFIQSLNKNINIIQREHKILEGKEIDIYLPDYKIGIEYNGLVWHNEKYINDKYYHLIKTEECNKKGIRLIHIFEDEWLFKKDIIKSRLSSILNEIKNKIYARKCEIKIVDSKISMQFLQNNHIQGKCKAKYHFGLYYNNELVSLMTFGKTRQMKKYNDDYDNTWELLRFCNKLNTSVVGGASKLLKYFINIAHPHKIISYADKRWSDGNLYEKLGFIHTHDSKPNYFYVIGQHRENRFKYRKGELVKKGFSSDKSEHEIMKEQGFYRIYDCGTMVYEKIFIE